MTEHGSFFSGFDSEDRDGSFFVRGHIVFDVHDSRQRKNVLPVLHVVVLRYCTGRLLTVLPGTTVPYVP